jgi:hypothetical protein
LFDIRIEESGVTCMPEMKMPAPSRTWYGSLPEKTEIQQAILECPTFFQHYAGLKIPWTYLYRQDREYLEHETSWVNRQGCRIVVDFSTGINHYPELTFLRAFPPHYDQSVQKIDDVLDKMVIFGAEDAVITLHRKPENHWDGERAQKEFLETIGMLCDRAAKRGIRIHLQPHHKRWVETVAKAREFAEQVGRKNLRVAINTGHLMISGEDPHQAVSDAGNLLGSILFSNATRDQYGQWYDAHRPFAGVPQDGWDLSVIGSRTDLLFILDANAPDIDAQYASLKAARSITGTD